MDPAIRACPFTQAEMLHVFVLMPATGAELARGEGLADLHDSLAVPIGFIFQHSMKLRPAHLGDGLTQFAVLLHVLHLQGFNSDDVVVFDDLG